MRKDIVLIFMLLWTYCIPLSGQESLNNTGAVHLSGSGAFQTSSHDLYKRNYGHLNFIYSKFVLNNVFVGGQISFSTDNVVFESNTMFDKYMDITLGPVVGYMFGNENSKAFPFVKLNAEAGYLNYRYMFSFPFDMFPDEPYIVSGAAFKLAGSLGVLVPFNNMLALNLEAGYMQKYLPEFEFPLTMENRPGHVFYSIGLTGTIY